MYSDYSESPSKDCFSFNDPLYNMAEVNEINNQADLDYIFDSFYSTRVSSHYDTGFDLPEDCKNMSFSELFDQELFSSQENKDCKITVDTMKEEPLKSSYFGDDSLDKTNSHSSINFEENISSSSPKTLIPKKGINRTLIKNTENCDVKHLINNPFCETEDNLMLMDPKIPVKIQKSKNTNSNTKIEQNILDAKTSCSVVRQQQFCNSVDDLQSNINDHVELKKNILFSSSKMAAPNGHEIDGTLVIKTENCEVEDVMYKSNLKKNNVEVEQTFKEIKNCKPVKINESIFETEKITSYSDYNSHNTTGSQEFVGVKSIEKNLLSPLLNNYTSNRSGKNKVSVKLTKRIKPLINHCFSKQTLANVKNENFEQNLDCTPCLTAKNSQSMSVNHSDVLSSVPNLVSMRHKNKKSSNKIEDHKVKKIINKPKTQNLSRDQMSAKVKTLANCEPKHEDCLAEQNIVGIVQLSSKRKLHVKIDTQDSIKNKNDFETSLSKSSSSKCHGTNKTIKNYDDQKLIYKQSCKSKCSYVEPSSIKTEIPIRKQLPKIIINAAKQKVVYSNSDSQKTKDCRNTVQNKNDFITAISQSLIPKRKSIKQTSIKASVNQDVKQIVKNPAYEVKDLNVDQTKVIKSEPKDQVVNLIAKETPVKIQRTIKEDLKCVDSNNFSSVCLNSTNVKKQEVIVVKEKNKTSLENNINSQTTCIAENEKKKITWEEFKAKREKMGLSSMPENNEDVSKDNTTLEIGELESIIKEFDRNTAVHFIGKKRKIDLEEKNITDVKEMNHKEILASQNKRLKIEYFQKLLPSSIASEIAKTSSFKKGILVEDNENDSTSNDTAMSGNNTKRKYSDTLEVLGAVSPKKDDNPLKKYRIPRISRTKSDVPYKTDSDGSYHHHDAAQVGQYSKNVHRFYQRSNELRRVVYVGQIPIRLGKPYLQNRFKKFGSIQCISLHKKPDFRVYYAFVTYTDATEAEQAIKHGNDDKTQVQLDIRYGERKQTQTPYYDLDDEWLNDWYGYKNQPLAVVRPPPQCPKKASYEDELKAFHKLAQNKKSNLKSQVS